MSNEALNKTWINRLEELDHVPGEAAPNKAAAWDRLHARLQHNKSRRRAAWYWSAAACLLIAGLLPLWPRHTKHTIEIHTPPAVAYRHSDTPATRLPVKKTAPVEQVRENAGPVSIAKRDMLSAPPIVVPPANPIHLPPAAAQDTVRTANIMLAAAPAAKAEKKMRVVHINELSAAGNTDIVYPEYKPFTIRINGPTGLGSPTIANNTLNIRLSQKN
jgi:hypothetical protein